MKEIVQMLYSCEVCGTSYKDREKCKMCEDFHSEIEKVTPHYKGAFCEGIQAFPYKIEVTFKNGMTRTYRVIR